MLSERGLAEMRVAATLAHRFSEVAVRLWDGDRLLAELGWEVTGLPEVTTLPPCGFRAAVRQAMDLHGQGRSQRFLDAAGDPAVQLGVKAPHRCWPSGILHLGGPDHHRYVFGTTTEPPRCRDVVVDAVDRFPHDDLLHGIGILSDREMRVSLVVAEVPGRSPGQQDADAPLPCVELPVLELMESVMATCAAESLVARLAEGSLLGEA